MGRSPLSEHPIVGSAQDLEPLIAAQREEGDRNANLTPEVVEACGAAGTFRMAAPRELNGLELLPPDVVAATQIASRADPAVG